MAGSQIFTFDSSKTIGDLLIVAERLKATGRTPTLHFVKSYAHELIGLEVRADEKEPGQYWPTPRPGLEKEMAVTEGADDDAPGPAPKLEFRECSSCGATLTNHEPGPICNDCLRRAALPMREKVIAVVNRNRARAGLLMLNAYEPDPRD